ncbi:MAG: HNH endonuclease [Actinomycetota bacterium]
MKAFLGVTDKDWFRFLASEHARTALDEVNFWQPSPHTFKALKPGEPFLFKLHYPDNSIAGGGFFAGHSRLPLTMAWEAFGPKNGTDTLSNMLKRIAHYRKVPVDTLDLDTEIGCILLEQPFFFPPDEWIPAPEDWASNIVVGKTYDLAERTDLWESIQYRLLALGVAQEAAKRDSDELFSERWVKSRLGQGSFRTLVTEAYQRRCAVTREKILPVLQAAHIRPVTRDGRHRVDNGLLLRSDVHTLFDRGYLTVEPDHRLRVSRHLRSDFNNGDYYYELSGSQILLPDNPADRPNPEFLAWHADKVFKE